MTQEAMLKASKLVGTPDWKFSLGETTSSEFEGVIKRVDVNQDVMNAIGHILETCIVAMPPRVQVGAILVSVFVTAFETGRAYEQISTLEAMMKEE